MTFAVEENELFDVVAVLLFRANTKMLEASDFGHLV
jgi:hypothetical protein